MGSHIVGERRFSPYGSILQLACGQRAVGEPEGPLFGEGPLCATCAEVGGDGLLVA